MNFPQIKLFRDQWPTRPDIHSRLEDGKDGGRLFE
jgi:hypothetical protein